MSNSERDKGIVYQLPGSSRESTRTSATSTAHSNTTNTTQNTSSPPNNTTNASNYAYPSMYALPQAPQQFDFSQQFARNPGTNVGSDLGIANLAIADPAIVQVTTNKDLLSFGLAPQIQMLIQDDRTYGTVKQVPQYSQYAEAKQYREVPRIDATQSLPRKTSIYVDMPHSASPSYAVHQAYSTQESQERRSTSAGTLGHKQRHSASLDRPDKSQPQKPPSAGSDKVKRVPVVPTGQPMPAKASPLHPADPYASKQASSTSISSIPRVPISASGYKASPTNPSHQSSNSSHSSSHPHAHSATHSTGHSAGHSAGHSSGSGRSQYAKPAGSDNRVVWPMSAEMASQQLGHILTPFEKQEIYSQREIWFAGTPMAEKIGSGKKRGAANQELNKPDPSTADSTDADADGVYNNGYDDARGDYILTLNDHVGYRYEVIGLLGKGSFGQVVRAFDHRDKREVALKIIRNKRRFEKQGLVECRVLETLRNEDRDDSYGIIHMYEYFHFRGHLCITFELLGVNLYEWLKAGGFKGVTLPVIRRFTTQILRCLYVLDRKKIVHCDLKPENVLLKESAHSQPSYADSNHFHSTHHVQPTSSSAISSSWYSIKVIDFGSSCFEHEKVYTYVQSRFYRSPEVILGISYNMSIDMWSLGCIMAEMHTGYPLFPGENEQEQLACIMEVKGVPDAQFIDRGSRKKLFFGRKRKPGTKQLPVVLRTNDMLFVDFIEKCLHWDPEQRMTPSQALQHEWIRGTNQSRSLHSYASDATLLPPSHSHQSTQSKSYILPTKEGKKY